MTKPIGTASYNFLMFISLAGVGVASEEKPVFKVVRPGSNSSATINASLISWNEIDGVGNGAGWYRVIITDDGTIFGAGQGLISQAVGEVVFYTPAVASHDAANRYVWITRFSVDDSVVTEPSSGSPPASAYLDQFISYLYFEMIKSKKDYDGTTEQTYMEDGSTIRYKRTETTPISGSPITTRSAPTAP